jgi:glutathione S-transferase
MSALTGLITALSLLLYFGVTVNVGRARARYKVQPPKMSGDPAFERVLRVQQNTLEQIVLFLPALWLFSQFVSPLWGAGLGAVWIVGRILYAWGYYQAAEKRFPGFAISVFAASALMLGGLIGTVLAIVKPS